MEQSRTLGVGDIISQGVKLGLESLGPLIVNGILGILTFWIPYLNFSVIVAMAGGIHLKIAKGESVSSTEVFNYEYRKYFPELLLQGGLMFVGILCGYLLLIIPGIILALGWSLANMYLIDGRSEAGFAALRKSWLAMDGSKAAVFGAYVIVALASAVLNYLLGMVPYIGPLMSFAASIFVQVLYIGIAAYVYRELVLGGVTAQGQGGGNAPGEDFAFDNFQQ